VFYALGYGANGIPFSALAAEVLTAVILKKSHRYQTTSAFDR
jgi:glycine/D-amino acid oxidase-like deaminating enzyme